MKEIKKTENSKYIFCIDAGASSSLGAAITLQGEVLWMGKTGPISGDYNEEAITNNLRTLIDSSLQNAKVSMEDCLCISLGIAVSPYTLINNSLGKSVENRLGKIVKRVYKDLGFQGPFLNKSDVETTWAGATACQPGIVVYAGTGSFAYGVNRKGNSVLIDPMCALLGDEGSAYFIGVHALKAVARSLDGRGSKTLLKEKIFKKFSINHFIEFSCKNWRSMSRREIAQLSPIVNECANEGDLVARDILNDAGSRLAKYANVAINRLDCETFQICYAGGVFSSQIVLNSFTQHLIKKHHVEIHKAKYDPIVGVFLLGCKQLSIEINRQLLARLSTNKYKLRKGGPVKALR